jgi:hypothetical protein
VREGGGGPERAASEAGAGGPLTSFLYSLVDVVDGAISGLDGSTEKAFVAAGATACNEDKWATRVIGLIQTTRKRGHASAAKRAREPSSSADVGMGGQGGPPGPVD